MKKTILLLTALLLFPLAPASAQLTPKPAYALATNPAQFTAMVTASGLPVPATLAAARLSLYSFGATATGTVTLSNGDTVSGKLSPAQLAAIWSASGATLPPAETLSNIQTLTVTPTDAPGSVIFKS